MFFINVCSGLNNEEALCCRSMDWTACDIQIYRERLS